MTKLGSCPAQRGGEEGVKQRKPSGSGKSLALSVSSAPPEDKGIRAKIENGRRSGGVALFWFQSVIPSFQ